MVVRDKITEPEIVVAHIKSYILYSDTIFIFLNNFVNK